MKFIALIGPSGSGKTTLMDELVKNPSFVKIKSVTSKDTRLEDYIKVSRSEFETMIENNEFIEYTEYAGNYYGLAKKCISQLTAIGIKAFDINGVKKLKDIFGSEVYVVFLYRETEKLIETINERDVSIEEKEARIKQLCAEQENRFLPEIDFVLEIVEDDIEKTVANLVATI